MSQVSILFKLIFIRKIINFDTFVKKYKLNKRYLLKDNQMLVEQLYNMYVCVYNNNTYK